MPGTVAADVPSADNLNQYAIQLADIGTLTAATDQDSAMVPFSGTIVDVRGRVGTAPTGSTATFDVNLNGTTIFTTQANIPTVAISGVTTTTILPDVTAVSRGDRLSLDCDQIGSTAAGANLGLAVTIRKRAVVL